MKIHSEPAFTLSSLVRVRRKELGLSVRAAASKAGISEFRWNWIERAANPRIPSPGVVASLACALELPSAALVQAAGYVIESETEPDASVAAPSAKVEAGLEVGIEL